MADVTTPSAATDVYLYLDCETVPTQDAALIAEIEAKHQVPEVDLSAIVAAANLTDPAKIEADIAKRKLKAMDDYDVAFAKSLTAIADEYRKTCLDATTGHIACIYHSFGDGPVAGTSNDALRHFRSMTVTVSPDGSRQPGDVLSMGPSHTLVVDEERKMLQRFFAAVDGMVQLLSKERWRAVRTTQPSYMGEFYDGIADIVTIPPVVVAHHAAFDLRYIWQRAIILGVEVPAWWPHDAKAWDTTKVQDTMLMWAGVGQRIGLDRLCKALGIQGKGDIDGSKVWDYVRDGRIAEVANYCGDDVERLRAVHRRIKGWPDLPTMEEMLAEEEADARAEMDAQSRYESGDDRTEDEILKDLEVLADQQASFGGED